MDTSEDFDIKEVRSYWESSIRPTIVNILKDRVFADRAEPEIVADELGIKSPASVKNFRSDLIEQVKEQRPQWEGWSDHHANLLLELAGDDGLGLPREIVRLDYLEHLPGLDQLPVPVSAIPGENETHPGREQTRKIELKNVFREGLLQRRLPWAGPAIEIVQKQKGEDKALFYVSVASRPETENSAPSSHLSSPMGLLFREAGQDQPQAVLLTEERPTAVVPEMLPSDWGEVTLDLYIEPPELVEKPEPKAILWMGSEFFPLQPRDTSAGRSWQVKGLDYEELSRYRGRQSPVRLEHLDLKLPTVRLDEFEEIPPGDQETGAPPKEQLSSRDRPEPRPVLKGDISGWRLVFSSSDSSSVFFQVEESTDTAVRYLDLGSREFHHPTSGTVDTLGGEEQEPSKTETEIDLRGELGAETVAGRLPWLSALRLGRYESGGEPLYYVEGVEEKEVSKSSNVTLKLQLHDRNSGEKGKAELSPSGKGSALQFFMPELSADWKDLTLILELPPMTDADD